MIVLNHARLPNAALAALGLAIALNATEARPAYAGGWDDRPSSGGFDFQLGGLAIVKPKYEGSKEYEVWGVPYVAPAGGNGDGFVQFKGVDDLRFRLLSANGFEAGPVVGYRFGRDQDDAARLQGLGDVDGGLVVGGYVAYRLGSIMPFFSYNHQVTGDETGGLARAGVELRENMGRGITGTLTAGVTWADGDYMDAYFGVSAPQAAASSFNAFKASAGFKDVYIKASVDVPLDPRWTLKLIGGYSLLLGDAADSPISETDNQWMSGVGLTYAFPVTR
ncbi:MAG: MipA/OmpV family protein [Hyphomicrobiaceae bacterium]|nr:MipA/OmpV family protein [Hyphomicrobiaceae bacterium]